ncbi:MAG: magnesium/cobalt transporter CorA [Desulfobacterales bacterium]
MNVSGTRKNRKKMPRFTKKWSHKAGSSPGTLVHIGEKLRDEARISLMDYDEKQLTEREIGSMEEAFPLKDLPTNTWINVCGLHDIELIEKVGRHFQIHPLTLEDILNTGQRPKWENFENYFYIVLKMLHFSESENLVISEQVSLIVGENFLISFQESVGDVFDPVRDRIRKGRRQIRKGGCDYLAYALIDSVVDHYFLILEKISERIEILETALLENPKPETLHVIHDLKRETIYLRKQIWPLREVISRFAKEETNLILETTHVYLRDVYDHTIQIIDTIESFRDLLSGMIDLYLSTISNKMNEVMKLLTIIATIFIPITFVAGIYGMNFKVMPELEWEWGYPAVWAVMAAIVSVLILFFRRKRWL